MAERIHPSAKPSSSNTTIPPTTTTTNPNTLRYPPSKSAAYSRPVYRPQPPKRRPRSRGCCCRCFLYTALIVVILIVLVAIAGTIFYFVYRPRAPKFSVSSLRIASLNVSNSNLLTSRIDLSVSASNPNKKLVYVYGDSTVAVSSGSVGIGNGILPAFELDAGNVTVLKTSAAGSGFPLDVPTAAAIKKDGSLNVDVVIDGKASVKVGGLKTKGVKVRVTCARGMTAAVPKGKAVPDAVSSGCDVKLRVKIWKWYI